MFFKISDYPLTAPQIQHRMANEKITYAHQKSLAKLPIPSLQETIKTFVANLSLLQSPSANAVTKSVAAAFLEKEGPKLQILLEEYDAEPGRASYIEEFWSDAYLAPDASVVLNLNPFFLLESGPDTKSSNSQTGRAASLVFSSLKFISVLKSEQLPPDKVRGDVPLCMDQVSAIQRGAQRAKLRTLRSTEPSGAREELQLCPSSRAQRKKGGVVGGVSK